MITVRLNLCTVVQSRSEVADALERAGDAALIVRATPRVLVLRCPSGCGEDHAINLDPRAGKAWRLYDRHEGLSLYPSVWLDVGCESHFIVWRSRILLFETARWRSEDGDTMSEDYGEAVNPDDVLTALSDGSSRSAEGIADLIGAVPWDVMSVCRQLERQRRLISVRVGTDRRYAIAPRGLAP